MKISGGKIILTAVVLCCCVGASDRSKSDPFAAIPEAERKDLATHLNGYISRLIPADWTDLNAHNDPPQAFVLVGSFSDLLHLRTLADALLRRSADLPVISGASQEGHARLALNEEDEQAAWEPVVVLHYRATPEVLAAAERLCFSYVSKERVLGANILGQLGVPERTFPEDCFRILCEMLGREQDPLVMEAIGVAFSHLHDKRAIPLLAPFSKHPDKEVRLGVVQGLSKHPDATAIATLIELTKDEDEDVRNWATFGLGTLVDSDTAELRAALLERVIDPHDETRGEALVGLARRKDPRVLGAIIQELSSEHVGLLALEAADKLGDSRLMPALLRLDHDWQTDQDNHVETLKDALRSCSVPERS